MYAHENPLSAPPFNPSLILEKKHKTNSSSSSGEAEQTPNPNPNPLPGIPHDPLFETAFQNVYGEVSTGTSVEPEKDTFPDVKARFGRYNTEYSGLRKQHSADL